MSTLEYINTRLTQGTFYSQESCQEAENAAEGDKRQEHLEKVQQYLLNHHQVTEGFKTNVELAESTRKIGHIFQKKLDKYKRNVGNAVGFIERAQKLTEDILKANSSTTLKETEVVLIQNRVTLLVSDLRALEAKITKIYGNVKTPQKYKMGLDVKPKWGDLLERVQSVLRLTNNVFKGSLMGIQNNLQEKIAMLLEEPSFQENSE